MWRIIVSTAERDELGAWVPVLEHHFLGATIEEAVAIYAAHLGADAFFEGCMSGEGYQGIVCRSTVRVVRG